MFTFSFGSTIAWAATTNYSVSDAEYYFGKAMDAVDDSADRTITVHGYTVEYETLDHFKTELLDAAKAYAKDADNNSYVTRKDDLSVLINSEGRSENTYDEIDNTNLAKDIVKYQYDEDRAAAVAHLNEAWTNSASDFSTEEMDPECKVTSHSCTTYQDHVKTIVDDAIDKINEFSSTTEKNFEEFVEQKNDVINAYIEAYNGEAESSYSKLIKARGYMAGNTPVDLGTYEINKNFADNSGYSSSKLDSYTTETKKYDDATSDAEIAALKAKAAQVYATYIQTTKKDKYKEYADNVLKACNFLYEEKVATDTTRIEALLATADYDDVYNAWADKLDYAVDQVAELEEEIAVLAAEKDSTGALVRDANDVGDDLKAGKIDIYKVATAEGIGGTGLAETKKAIDKAVSDAIAEVTALYKSLDSEKLTYYKEYAKAEITNAYDDAKDYYYGPEYTAYKALINEYATKIDSAKDNKEVKKYVDELGKPASTSKNDSTSTGKIDNKIDNKYIIDQKTASIVSTAEKYAADENNRISGTSNDYYLGSGDAKLKEVIEEYVGASSARTQKEIDALAAQAIGLVSTLPTNSEVEKAEDAADDAVKALPKTITVDSKAAIDAAIAAVDAYEDLTAGNYTESEKTKLTTAITNYAYAVNKNIKDRLDAVSKTDKEALKTLKAEVTAFEDTYEDYTAATKVIADDVKKEIQKKLDDNQKTEKDAVKAAIRAIPVKANITEADKATVENARKLYDAYVAEYTEYDSAFNWDTTTDEDGFVADDFGTSYQDLVGAETVLGLNEDPAAPVEALKLKASSTAKKGSITVKWTVTGDASTVDGYEIWKSTKQSKGYKKAFTTTKTTYKNTKDLKKGTRYYYKVRAYKMVDGVKVTSDWSNKAYRKAK